AGAKPKRRERWRLAIRNHFAEVRRIRGFEPFEFKILDLPGAEDFDCDAAGFALDVEKTKHGNINFSFPRAASLPSHHESRGLLNGFQEGHGELAGLHLPIGYRRAENLID